MRDTTQIEIISRQLEKITSTTHSANLTSGQVALLAAAIGATAAILSQFVVFLLTRYKERGNLRKELVAEERRIAFLLTEYYKDFVMHKVHKQYWYRTAEVYRPSIGDSKDSHKRHFVSNERSFETLAKIRDTTSQYFKTITHFTNLTGQNKIISYRLSEIKSFKPRKASTFSEIATYDELLIAEPIEEEDLNKVYQYYSDCFDKINSEMTKRM